MDAAQERRYLLKDFYGDNYLLAPYITKYRSNNKLAILLFSEDGALFCDMTVNITDSNTCDSSCAFVDTNNSPWLIDFIQANELGKKTGRFGVSGFCSYPEFAFDLAKMNEE